MIRWVLNQQLLICIILTPMIFWFCDNNKSRLRLFHDRLLFNSVILYPHHNHTYHFVPSPSHRSLKTTILEYFFLTVAFQKPCKPKF